MDVALHTNDTIITSIITSILAAILKNMVTAIHITSSKVMNISILFCYDSGAKVYVFGVKVSNDLLLGEIEPSQPTFWRPF